MLQQTQVSRVIPKYKSFLKKFPTIKILARASLKDVLVEWQGLGYNRRGMYLKKCAEKIVADFNGEFPQDFKTLTSLPGIGPATAGDILAFAYNVPTVVIETNIRSVFIHHFFSSKKKVSDKKILPLIEQTLDTKNPREWYSALFDYGAYLKSKNINPSRKSAHHTKQTNFAGSNRQKRAVILKLILEKPRTEREIVKTTKYESDRVMNILKNMIKDGLIDKVSNLYKIARGGSL